MFYYTCIIITALLVTACSPLQFSGSDFPYTPPHASSIKHPSTVLVLSGGGARGIAHIGVLKALHELDIQPDLIIGSSAGAIVGAIYAQNANLDDLTNLKSKHFNDFVLYSSATLPYSLSKASKLEAFLSQQLDHKNFSQLKIPLIVITTNLEFGNVTTFSSGDLIAPILASASIPGFFPPVEIENQLFVDGGVSNNLAVDIAKQYNPDRIIASNITTKLENEAPPTNILGLVLRSLKISLNAHMNQSCSLADDCINIKTEDRSMFDTKHSDELYDLGYHTAKAILLGTKH